MKQWWNKRNSREKAMVVAILLACVCSLYLTQRVTIMQQEKEVMKEQLDEAKKQKQKTRPIKLGAVNIKKVQKDIVFYETENERLKANIVAFNDNMLDISMSESIAEAQSKITRLANNNRLKVVHVKRSKNDIQTVTGIKPPRRDMNIIRPFMDIRFQGNFFDTQKFIESLGLLPFSISILKINIETMKNVEVRDNRLLDTQLTLGF